MPINIIKSLQKSDFSEASLCHYVNTVCDPESTDVVYYLFLDLFFIYSEDPIPVSQQLAVFQSNKVSPQIALLTQALQLCEEATRLLRGGKIEENAIFFGDLKAPLLKIARDKRIDVKMCRRAFHFLLLAQHILLQLIKPSVYLFDDIYNSSLPLDLSVSPKEFVTELRGTRDFLDRNKVFQLIDIAYCLAFYTNLTLRRCRISTDIASRNAFFLLYFYSEVSEEINKLIERFTDKALKFHSDNIGYLDTHHFSFVGIPIAEICLLKKSVADILGELAKPHLRDMDSSALTKAALSDIFLSLLDENILSRLQESQSQLPREVVETMQALSKTIEKLVAKCRLLLNPPGEVFVGISNRLFAIQFLLIPAIFGQQSVEVQKRLLIAGRRHIEDVNEKASVYKDLKLENPKWLESRLIDDLPSLSEELSLAEQFAQPFFDVYKKRKSELDETCRGFFEEFYTEHKKIKTNQNIICRLQNMRSALDNLYKRLIGPFCDYLQTILDRYPETNGFKSVLSQFRNSRWTIKTYYLLFLQLKNGEISEQSFVNTILNEQNSSSLRASLESVLRFQPNKLPLSQRIFKHLPERFPRVQSLDAFIKDRYEALSREEKKKQEADPFYGIDFSTIEFSLCAPPQTWSSETSIEKKYEEVPQEADPFYGIDFSTINFTLYAPPQSNVESHTPVDTDDPFDGIDFSSF